MTTGFDSIKAMIMIAVGLCLFACGESGVGPSQSQSRDDLVVFAADAPVSEIFKVYQAGKSVPLDNGVYSVRRESFEIAYEGAPEGQRVLVALADSTLNDLLASRAGRFVIVRAGQGMPFDEINDLVLIDPPSIELADDPESRARYAWVYSEGAISLLETLAMRLPEPQVALDAGMIFLREDRSRFQFISGTRTDAYAGDEVHVTQLVEVGRAGPRTQAWPIFYVFEWRPFVLRFLR
jgi:hypothetical protein